MVQLKTRDEIDGALRAVIEDMSRLLGPGLKIARMPDGSLMTSTGSRHLTQVLSRGGDIDKIVRTMVIDACSRAETQAPGCSRTFIKLLELLVNGRTLGFKQQDLIQMSRPATMQTLERMVHDSVPDVADMLIEAIRLAGGECKIFIEPSVTRQPSVELTRGYTFRCSPDPQFFRDGKWTAFDVKCVVIDGIIDKVSEIDSLLQRCNDERRTMAIFARGFDRDVLSTLRVNHARKTLNVIPIIVEFDLETVNVLLDIATAIGSDVVSSLKGELISTIKFDEVKTVRSIVCMGRSATIGCQGASVEAHVKNLLQKRRDETLPAVKQIIDQRLKSLSPSSVTIKVDDSGPGGGRTMHDLDMGLRMVRSVLMHGVLRREDLERAGIGAMADAMGDECPTSWVIASLQVGLSLISTLSTVTLSVVESS